MKARSLADEQAWKDLFDPLAKLRADWPMRGWSWDGRFSCVSSSFNVEFEPRALALAKVAMPNEWTSGTIASAPPEVRKIADNSGGLRAGQLLLTGKSIAFGLWWPWGDGTTTSLRIGCRGVDDSDDVLVHLRNVFGVSV